MIRNKTTGKIISRKERICKTFFSHAFGLMFRKKQNLVMVFRKPKRISLHMFFVFYPIDVLVLDEAKRIVDVKRGFRQFSVWTSTKRGKYVVELAYPSQYSIGDNLEF